MVRLRFVQGLILMVLFLPAVKAGIPLSFIHANISLETGRDTTIEIPHSFHDEMLEIERSYSIVHITPLNDSLIILKIRHGLPGPGKQISIIAVGDIMPGTNYPKESYLPPDCSALFGPVNDLIRSADIATGNLEGVFSSVGGTPKTCKDPDNCYVFRIPDEYIHDIIDAGFDILGTANNHVNDFGPVGRASTAALLEKAGMHFAGFSNFPYTVYQCQGLKVAYCAFAPHTGTLDLKDYKGAAALIRQLDAQCDIVIVGFHGGAEGRDHQHVTRQDEDFLGNNRGNVYDLPIL